MQYQLVLAMASPAVFETAASAPAYDMSFSLIISVLRALMSLGVAELWKIVRQAVACWQLLGEFS